jgi:hypothetical protein
MGTWKGYQLAGAFIHPGMLKLSVCLGKEGITSVEPKRFISDRFMTLFSS